MLSKKQIAGITSGVRRERYARLRAGIQAGLLASVVLGFVIWLFGYITGFRLATSLLEIAAVCFGFMAGAQAYISDPEERNTRDEVLAELEKRAQEKALGGGGSLGGRKSRRP